MTVFHSIRGLVSKAPYPNERRFFWWLLILSIPILLINLGLVAFIEDEGIRSLVALEMDLSGNFITPTLNGEYYFKKPPLWNWILWAFFELTGQANEFTARLATVTFLYIYVISIYFVFRKYTSEGIATLNGLLFLTCGRILFWDSMLALIDVCFSWVIFMLFWWIYEFHRRRDFLALYVGAYVIASVGFFLKALPALVFLGFTLLVWQLINGTWRKLFSWQHLLGGITMASIIGLYLLQYQQQQGLEHLLKIFWDESTQRTVVKHGFLKSILHVITFPFETLYHFLPWSLISILFFTPGARKVLFKNDFLRFCFWVFFANIWIYWISPRIFPRYLFMFVPLYFGCALYLYQQKSKTRLSQYFHVSILVLAGATVLGSLSVFWLSRTVNIPLLGLKWSLSAVLMLTFFVMMLYHRKARLLYFCAFLIAVRFGFNLIVLPSRNNDSVADQTRIDSKRIGVQFKDQPLYLLPEDSMRYEASFYITKERNKILPVVEDPHVEGYLLINPHKYPNLLQNQLVIDSVRVRKMEKFTYLIKSPVE